LGWVGVDGCWGIGGFVVVVGAFVEAEELEGGDIALRVKASWHRRCRQVSLFLFETGTRHIWPPSCTSCG